MKVGDKVICICNDCDYHIYFDIDGIYNITYISNDDYDSDDKTDIRVHVYSTRMNRNCYFYLNGDYRNKFYKYFRTLREHRKLKLERINNV
jgi:hypothetical protein